MIFELEIAEDDSRRVHRASANSCEVQVRGAQLREPLELLQVQRAQAVTRIRPFVFLFSSGAPEHGASISSFVRECPRFVTFRQISKSVEGRARSGCEARSKARAARRCWDE